jgi:hypothetical protein
MATVRSETELTNTFIALDQQINDLFSQMRIMHVKNGNQGANDAGFTEGELMAQLDEIGDSDY